MRPILLLATAALATTVAHSTAVAQQTPPAMVSTYAALASTILSVKRAEKNFVLALLDGHGHQAAAKYERGDYEGAAAEITLFANEGDNAIAGIRKRLVEAGHHHHHASGEELSSYDPGFIIVDKASKAALLEAAAALSQARKKAAATEAWNRFVSTADALLQAE